MNSKHWSCDNLPVREYEIDDSILRRTFPRQFMTFHRLFPVLCSDSGDCVNIRENLLYFFSLNCWDVFLWGQDSCLPHPGWKITFPLGNNEGKEKVAKNQRENETSRCLYWIGPYFCLTSLGKWEFAQNKPWQDEIKHCFTVPHLTYSDWSKIPKILCHSNGKSQ